MATRIEVGAAADIPEREGRCVEHENESYAVFRIDGAFFACSGRCPHAGGPLHDGFLRGTEVICPWHGWGFELDCGEEAPRDGVIRYPVEVEEDIVYLVLPD